MSKPPQDVEPSELWLKLCEKRPSEVVDFPRRDADGNFVGKVRIQVLTMEDHNKARLLATQALKKHVKEIGMEALDRQDMDNDAVREVLGDLVAHELLFQACLSEKNYGDDDSDPVYAKLFKSTDDIRKKLTADETLILFNAYRLTQHKWGPFEKTMTDDGDVEAWITRLKEGGSAFPLLALQLPQLADLAYTLSEKISSLCQILGSQWTDLPDSLKSKLTDCFTDTTLFGLQHDGSTQTFLADSREFDINTAMVLANQSKQDRESGIEK